MNDSGNFPLRGVLPVFQTPFHDDETIDFDLLRHEIDWLFECGAQGIVMAMVSEVLRLSTDEREQMAAEACGAGRGRGAVVVSVGSESGFVSQRLARHAQDHGATAVMAIPPIAVTLGDGELLRYYERLARAVSIPIIVQDASGYVGRSMSIDLQASLLHSFGDRVLFKPEAAPIGPRLSQLRDATGGRARVFEGSGGAALLDSYRRGIVGTMPGADLIKVIVALWHALESGDSERANRLWMPLAALVAIQTSLDGFLAVEKYLLVRQGIFRSTRTRGPVGFVLDDETRREVDRLFDLLMRQL
jgi:dihydrodipicolinate synthase/N-acetylneuraminate lyase